MKILLIVTICTIVGVIVCSIILYYLSKQIRIFKPLKMLTNNQDESYKTRELYIIKTSTISIDNDDIENNLSNYLVAKLNCDNEYVELFSKIKLDYDNSFYDIPYIVAIYKLSDFITTEIVDKKLLLFALMKLNSLEKKEEIEKEKISEILCFCL